MEVSCNVDCKRGSAPELHSPPPTTLLLIPGLARRKRKRQGKFHAVNDIR